MWLDEDVGPDSIDLQPDRHTDVALSAILVNSIATYLGGSMVDRGVKGRAVVVINVPVIVIVVVTCVALGVIVRVLLEGVGHQDAVVLHVRDAVGVVVFAGVADVVAVRVLLEWVRVVGAVVELVVYAVVVVVVVTEIAVAIAVAVSLVRVSI